MTDAGYTDTCTSMRRGNGSLSLQFSKEVDYSVLNISVENSRVSLTHAPGLYTHTRQAANTIAQ